jgi:hypothetical protein
LRRANRNHERVGELERALERAPRTKHRRLALPIGGVASLAADIGDEEAAKAVAEYAFMLSTSGRPSRKHRDRAAARLAERLARGLRTEEILSAYPAAVVRLPSYPDEHAFPQRAVPVWKRAEGQALLSCTAGRCGTRTPRA